MIHQPKPSKHSKKSLPVALKLDLLWVVATKGMPCHLGGIPHRVRPQMTPYFLLGTEHYCADYPGESFRPCGGIGMGVGGVAVVCFAFWAFDGRRIYPMTARVLTAGMIRQIRQDLEWMRLPCPYLKAGQTLWVGPHFV